MPCLAGLWKLRKVICTEILNAGEVSEIKGCYKIAECPVSAYQATNGIFGKNNLKEIVILADQDDRKLGLDETKIAEAGGLVAVLLALLFF